MIFEIRVAFRYLISARLQTLLLTLGVAVGVVVFTFIAALMNGLGKRLVDDVTGSVAHVSLEPEERLPPFFLTSIHTGMVPHVAVQPGRATKPLIRTYRPYLEMARRTPGVCAVVPEAFGAGILARGEKENAVAVTGVDALQIDEIAPLRHALVQGDLDIRPGNIVLGATLAKDLGVTVGDRVLLRPPALRDVVPLALTVRGIFLLGIQAVDERVIYMDIQATKTLFQLDGVSVIEIKVDDVWQAQAIADRLARTTPLKVSSWLERNVRLQEGLRAQASSGEMIKGFSLVTIAIGVASALFLSVSRRRSEIGILRSFGIGRGAILRTFVLQGLFIGMIGATIGVVLGYGFAELLLHVSRRADGTSSMPIDPASGEYLRAFLLTTIASALAAVLPARTAAKLDPLQAIQS
jgi:lipoprotein-releasing system permease protein